MKHTTKRILAFLLCFELLLSMACNAIPVVHATEDTCDCPMTDGLHAASCPNYTCPDCGAAEWHETCPVTGDEPAEDDGEAEAPGTEEESTVCETCGNDPCSCESEEEADEEEATACEACGAEEGAVHAATCPNYTCPDCGAAEWHETCPATDEEETEEKPAVDYSGDIGKYAQIIESEYAFFVCDGSSISENDSTYFYFDEFEEGTILRITNWHWDPDTTALWYQVEFYSGGVLEESTEYWPADPWILQDYTDETYEYDASLVFVPTCGVCGKPDCATEHIYCDVCGKYDCGITHTTCSVCGKPDCTTEHVWCDTCGKYDCGLTHTTCGVCGKETCTAKHTYCGVCGGLDCTAEHVYCSICKDFDCGIEHEPEPEEEIDNKPITTPVIPETPSLPDEYDVAIVTDSGALVTEAGGFRLSAGYKASLSAWSALGEDVSYQWQIRYDAENDLWADITGQTGKGLLFSHAMFAGAQDDAGRAHVRCVTSVDGETLTSEPVCITIDYTDYEAASASAEVAAAAFSLRTDSASLVAYADGDDDDDIEYVTITVKYLDADSFIEDAEQSAVSSSYIASIQAGTAFEQTIVSPTVTGYAPFWDTDGDGQIWTGEDWYDTTGAYTVPGTAPTGLNESASEITLSLTAEQTTENYVYYVYYLPIKVNIGVRYYFQNLDDDNYTEDITRYHSDTMRTGTIVGEDYLTEHAGDVSGYTRMYHQPEAVAADGSTVFRCYYDRNYYLINFTLDGGYGVEPVYDRFGANVMAGTPTRAGYSFNGWVLTDITHDDTNGAVNTTHYANALPPTILAQNRTYAAKWTPLGNTAYTVAYWIVDDHSDTNHSDDTFIGSILDYDDAGKTVSGSDSLTSSIYICGLDAHTHDSGCRTQICGLEAHTHSDACKYCQETEHTHSLTNCYATDGTPTPVTNLSGTDKDAYDAFVSKLGSATGTDLTVYKYTYQYWNWGYVTYQYNFFYYENSWYLLGTGTEYCGISVSLSNPSNGNYYSSTISACTTAEHTHADKCNDIICGKTEHTHVDACYDYTCGKVEHAHSGCTFDTSHLDFVRADTGVEINGDGSTVVNVYYTYHKYTLRFYYARTSTADGLEVVGGTSWPFGRYDSRSSETTTVDTLLSYVTQWGKVAGLTGTRSDFNDIGKDRVDNGIYTLGTYAANGFTYYYLEFTAAYGDSLENLWPVDIFASVTTREKHGAHYNGITCAEGAPAYFSAWNGEYKVRYSGTHSGNPTIKGLYMYLDDEILYDSAYTTRYTALSDGSRLVNYLGFWDNGYNISWSYPKMFQYHLWVEPLNGTPSASDTTYGDFTGNTASQYANYVLYKNFNVYDDSTTDNQTATALEGYEYVDRASQQITTGLPNGIVEGHRVDFFYDGHDHYTLTVNNRGTTIGAASDVSFQQPLAKLLDDIEAASGKELFTDDDSDDNGDGVLSYIPPYPSSLETGGYYFDGWYTSSTCVPGTEVDLATAEMPAGNMAIYAKWSPVTRTVRFFYHHEYLDAFEEGKSSIQHDTNGDGILETIDFVTGDYGMKTVEVLHGHTVEEEKVPVLTQHQLDPDNDKMNFVNWFYIEGNQKKAYSPTEIPVKRDLNVYAEWRDGTAQPYQLNYVKVGTDTPIAESTLGYSDRGVLRTFTAKAGYPNNDLYNLTGWTDDEICELYGLTNPTAEELAKYRRNYNSGFFPLTSSHSFIVQEELPENWYSPVINVYDFEYVEATHVKYTVRHVYKASGQVIKEEVKYTDYAVVTERFMEVEDYVADAFYKELVIAVVEDPDHPGQYIGADSNVITFYYTASGDALYAIHHMVEKVHSDDVYAKPDELAEIRANYAIDGTGGYEEYGKPIQQIAEVGATIDITPSTIPGYELITDDDVAKYTVGGSSPTVVNPVGGKYTITVHKAGTELYLFYKRLDYQYTVHYYKFNTKELVDPTNLPSVTATAPYHSTVTESAPLYTKDKGYTLVSAAEQSLQIRQENDQNIIIFYYSPIQYQLDYYMVPPEGGSLTLSKEVDSGTEPFTGSTATANPNYKFIGWYTDEACTNEVELGVTADTYTKSDASGSLIPTRLMDNAGNPITKYAFYAKFELQAADFTIIRENGSANQAYVYEVRSKTDPSFVIYVAIEGTGSKKIVKLPLGEYTVTQQRSWSWRYTSNTVVDVNHTGSDSVTFSTGRDILRWLTGSSVRSPTGE